MRITEDIAALLNTVFTVDTLMIIYAIGGSLWVMHVVITVVLIAAYVLMRIFGLFFKKKEQNMRITRTIIKWFSDLKRIGYAGAVYNLGSQQHEVDLTKAFKWYLRAAKLGYISAQSQAGTLLLLGMGVEQDTEEGKEWLLKASKQGCEHATWRLHFYYLSIVEDDSRALLWAQRAAEMSYAPAYMTLGNCHEYGIGTEANFEIAKMYYQLALDCVHEDPELRRKKKLHPIILIDYVQPTKNALDRINYNIQWGRESGRTDAQVVAAMLEYYERQDQYEQEQSRKVPNSQAQTDVAGKAIDVETHLKNEANSSDQNTPTIH